MRDPLTQNQKKAGQPDKLWYNLAMSTQTGPTQREPDPRTPGVLRVTKEVHWHCAHYLRVCDATPACTRVHGHTYKLQATWEILSCPDHLDEEGMVTNFQYLKNMLGRVRALFDHYLVNGIELPELKRLGRCTFDPKVVNLGKVNPDFADFTLLETTAEMMVWWIGEYLLDLTNSTRSQITFKECTLWETETSSATWCPAVSYNVPA